jgi:Ion channel
MLACCRYITALYWAMSTLTTVGYGDVIPGNSSEKVQDHANLESLPLSPFLPLAYFTNHLDASFVLNHASTL